MRVAAGGTGSASSAYAPRSLAIINQPDPPPAAETTTPAEPPRKPEPTAISLPDTSYRDVMPSAAPSAAPSSVPLTTGQKVAAFFGGVKDAVVDTVKGVAALGQLADPGAKGIVARAETAVSVTAYVTSPPKTPEDAAFRASVKSAYATGGIGGAATAVLLYPVAKDAVNTATLGYRAVTGDPTMTRDDYHTLGGATLNTVVNVATVTSGVKAATGLAEVGQLGIEFTSKVSTVSGSSRVLVEGAQSTARVVVKGAGAEEIAKTLAQPANRTLLKDLAKVGSDVTQAKSIGARGTVGEETANDIRNALGYTERLPTKFPNGTGMDVGGRNPTTGGTVGIEGKATIDGAKGVPLRKTASGAIQGTPDYNDAALKRMLGSNIPELQNSARTFMQSPSTLSLGAQVTGKSTLTIFNGETVQQAVANGGVAGARAMTGGTITPGLTRVETASTIGTAIGIAVGAARSAGVTQTVTAAAPQPKPVPVASSPQPKPVQVAPAPTSQPKPAPTAAPQSKPTPAPAPQPKPAPAPVPQPKPAPAPQPKPAPAPQPKPAPAPAPQPKPAPASQPKPAPAPQPKPAPAPQPKPAPATRAVSSRSARV